MNVTCKDRERIFEDGTVAEWAALEAHAVGCAVCAEEVRVWKSLSIAAKDLQDYSEGPELWTRIKRALILEDARKTQGAERKRWLPFLPAFSAGWQMALAGAFVLILAVSAVWIIREPIRDPVQGPLLKSAALKEVESTEKAYEK